MQKRVIIQITEKPFEETESKVRRESTIPFHLFETLNLNPKNGKQARLVRGILVIELKYKTIRFYFITDGFKLKIVQNEELTDLLMQCVRMSNKKHQQKVLDEIRKIPPDYQPDYSAWNRKLLCFF